MKDASSFRIITIYSQAILIFTLLATFSITDYASAAILQQSSAERIVVLDPGHGWGNDPGATANNLIEKDINLSVALLAKPILEAYGYQVYLTRTGDEPNYSLSEAARRANQYGADIVVSIHVNAGGGTGTESCYQINKPTSDQSQVLAGLLTQKVSDRLGLVIRGNFPEHSPDRCDRYNSHPGWTQLYIHDMNAPAALIELAFIDGPPENDVAKLRDRQPDFAQAIADAVSAYFGGGVSKRNTATMLVMDVSGSMADPWQGGVKIDSAKAAANQIVNMIQQETQLTNANHQVGISVFSPTALLHLGLTSDFNLVRQKLAELYPLSGTNIGAGLEVANQGMQQADPGAAKIIILLSDGMTNTGLTPSEIIAGPVQESIRLGACIYTVGFGDQGNLDEELLRQIASSSGCGKYYYATDVGELEKVYIRIRHQSTGDILAEFSGQVAQGERLQAGTVDVPVGKSELTISLHWPGSEVELIIHDPAGQVLSSASPGVNIVKYANLVYAIINQPIPGNWLLEVLGVNIPSGTEPYDIIVSARQAPITPTPTFSPTPTNTPVSTPPPLPPSGGGGFPVAILILLIGGGGIAIYVYATVLRRQRQGGLAGFSPWNRTGTGSFQNASAVSIEGPYLSFIQGPLRGRDIPLRSQTINIGRGASNQLQIPDITVSRLHCIIRFTQGVWLIQDQYSKSGTFINDQQVTTTRLHNGDRIRIGSTEMIIHLN